MGRIAVDVFRGSANLVYALIEAEPASGGSAPIRPDAGAGGGAGGAPAGAAGGRGGGGGPAQAGGGRGGGRRGGGGRARPVSIDRTMAARRGGG